MVAGLAPLRRPCCGLAGGGAGGPDYPAVCLEGDASSLPSGRVDTSAGFGDKLSWAMREGGRHYVFCWAVNSSSGHCAHQYLRHESRDQDAFVVVIAIPFISPSIPRGSWVRSPDTPLFFFFWAPSSSGGGGCVFVVRSEGRWRVSDRISLPMMGSCSSRCYLLTTQNINIAANIF